MRSICYACLLIGAGAFLADNVSAAITLLDGSTLPQSQGWEFVGYPNAQPVHIEHDGIVFDSTGSHPNSYGVYFRSAPLPPKGRLSVELSLRLLQSPGQAASSAAFYSWYDPATTLGGGPARKQMIVFEFDRIRWGDNTGNYDMPTTDSFHQYRLDVEVGGAATLSVDGIPRLHREGFFSNGVVAFGDMTNTPGMDASFIVASISFTSDCNENTIHDDIEIVKGLSDDCDQNGVADVCEDDCNGNTVADHCDIATGFSLDLDFNAIPDECEPDCNQNIVPDAWDISQGTSGDCDLNQIPDECDILENRLKDFDGSGKPDLCESPIVYVSPSAPPGGDGSSWGYALSNINDALQVAPVASGEHRQIWLRAGTYRPATRLDPMEPRSATFFISKSVKIYGGFAGYEDSLSQRDGEMNQTILSGDLAGDDQPDFGNRNDNARHVIRTVEYADVELLLDSIVVRGGHSDEASYNFGGALLAYGKVTLRDCSFEDDWSGPVTAEGTVAHSNGGGAVAVYGNNDSYDENSGVADVVWENCRFRNNHSAGTGGAVFLSGLSVQFSNCVFEGNHGSAGGGMGFEPLARLYFDNCTFLSNSADTVGGAIAALYGLQEFKIAGCRFEDNTAKEGGALFIDEGAQYFEIKDSDFERNAAGFNGGAILVDSAYSLALLLKGCTFSGNSAQELGGALALDEGATTIARCAFDSNSASEGGAINIDNDRYGAELKMSDCTFLSNEAIIGGGLSSFNTAVDVDRCEFRWNNGVVGGAASVTSDQAPSVFTSSLFHGNWADLYGGAIAGGTGGLTISRSTIVQNTAGGLAAGILSGSDTLIEGSIVWDNSMEFANSVPIERIQIEGYPIVLRSIVQGWSGDLEGEGNISLDPRFINSTGNYGGNCCLHDFRLAPDSPARNAGNPDFIPAFGDADLDGHERVLCGRVDMGAYEFGFGDADCDGSVGTWDLAVWVACAEGEIEGDSCEAMDSDVDGDFDLRDFGALQNAW